MEEHLLYILYSQKYNKVYRGVTSNLIARFHSHNSLGRKGWTRHYRPWIVVHIEVYQTRSIALKREKFLKSGKGRQWIKDNIIV